MLDPVHVNFLLSPDTLISQAGKTMQERTILFHRKFATKTISKTALWRLYKDNGVKRKSIKINKTAPPPSIHNYEDQRQKALGLVTSAKKSMLPIIFLDEIIFSKHTISVKTPSLKSQ
jgi:hypothetical protein